MNWPRNSSRGLAEANLATFKLAMQKLEGMMFEKLDANGG
jgi:hypothetical protein